MTAVEVLLLAGAGLIAGAVNALAGGGTFFTFSALVAAGLPPVIANATSAVAVTPASIASAYAYRSEIGANFRRFAWLSAASGAGGLLGGFLLLRIENAEFRALVPWLLLAATLLFVASPVIARVTRADQGSRGTFARTFGLALQFVTSIYGGFFGAGMGIVMLASLTITEGGDYHRINAGKNLFSILIQGLAIVLFIWGGIVSWPEAAVVTVAAILGGYYGVAIGRAVPQRVVRLFVIAAGAVLTAVFFVAT